MSLEKMKSQQPKSSIHEQTCGRPNLANQAITPLKGHQDLGRGHAKAKPYSSKGCPIKFTRM